MELLKRNLSSFQSTTIRLLLLRILAWFPTESNNHVIYNCLACEECPLTVYEYRSMIIFLQKLSVDFVLSHQSASSFHRVMLLPSRGLLCSHLIPQWNIWVMLIFRRS
jgi:hypothetical protein